MSELHRPGLLRRDPGGDRRRAAHRALDRHADPHAAGRHPGLRLRLARRHQAHPAVPGQPRRVLRLRGRGASTWPSASRRPVFMLSDLDIGMNDWVTPAAEVGRQLPPGPRARADRGRAREAGEVLPLLAARTRTTSRRARCPACIRRAPSSRAARATTSSAATPRSRTSTRRSMDRLPRKHNAAAKCGARAGDRRRSRAPRFGIISLGGCDPAVREAVDVLAERGHRRRLHARPRLPLRRDGRAVPGRARPLLRGRAEPRRASCARC